MKKLAYILLIIFITACSLDFPVEDEITGLDVIDNVAIANESLSSVYRAFPKNTRIEFSKLADDFYPNHTIDDNIPSYNLYKWEKRELTFLSNELWAAYYKTIVNANVLLNRINAIAPQTTSEQEELQFIQAQALCLKAYAFFELIQIYAPAYNETTKNELGIIIKNNIASEELPRSSLEESYKQTEILLLQAISLFTKENETLFRFSKRSAKALLAKVYLNWNKYEKAIKLCNELLPAATINETSFSLMWENLENKNEVLLALEGALSYFSDIYDTEQNDDEYYINNTITFTPNDVRKDNSFINQPFRMLDNSVVNVNFLGKYRTVIADVNPKSIAAIRVAELYFIKAECLYKLSRNTEAITIINNFLSLRKATTTVATLDEMLKEKQKEFIGEGLRYFDIKRNAKNLPRVNYKTNTEVFSVLTNDFRWQLPIPASEIKDNKNVQQNKGW